MLLSFALSVSKNMFNFLNRSLTTVLYFPLQDSTKMTVMPIIQSFSILWGFQKCKLWVSQMMVSLQVLSTNGTNSDDWIEFCILTPEAIRPIASYFCCMVFCFFFCFVFVSSPVAVILLSLLANMSPYLRSGVDDGWLQFIRLFCKSIFVQISNFCKQQT